MYWDLRIYDQSGILFSPGDQKVEQYLKFFLPNIAQSYMMKIDTRLAEIVSKVFVDQFDAK